MQTQSRIVGLAPYARATFLCWVYCALFVMASVASAQTRGGFRGVVIDTSGARVKDATVAAREVATGVGRETRADATGAFALVALAPGDYVLEVRAAGYKTW